MKLHHNEVEYIMEKELSAKRVQLQTFKCVILKKLQPKDLGVDNFKGQITLSDSWMRRIYKRSRYIDKEKETDNGQSVYSPSKLSLLNAHIERNRNKAMLDSICIRPKVADYTLNLEELRSELKDSTNRNTTDCYDLPKLTSSDIIEKRVRKPRKQLFDLPPPKLYPETEFFHDVNIIDFANSNGQQDSIKCKNPSPATSLNPPIIRQNLRKRHKYPTDDLIRWLSEDEPQTKVLDDCRFITGEGVPRLDLHPIQAPNIITELALDSMNNLTPEEEEKLKLLTSDKEYMDRLMKIIGSAINKCPNDEFSSGDLPNGLDCDGGQDVNHQNVSGLSDNTLVGHFDSNADDTTVDQ